MLFSNIYRLTVYIGTFTVFTVCYLAIFTFLPFKSGHLPFLPYVINQNIHRLNRDIYRFYRMLLTNIHRLAVYIGTFTVFAVCYLAIFTFLPFKSGHLPFLPYFINQYLPFISGHLPFLPYAI